MVESSVETVLGPVSASSLGRTLTHEHLALDFHKFYVSPREIYKDFFYDRLDINNIGVVKQYPYSSKYNLRFNDEDCIPAVLYDVEFFKNSGGGTIVENTSHGIKRDLTLMQKVSRETGIHVIAGTGHYVAVTQDSDMLGMSEEKLYDLIQSELTVGCIENSKIKAGFIGEVGSSWPIEVFERKVIRATAQVQQELRCPVSFHPGRDPQAPFEIMRIYTEAGGDPTKAIMSHLDRTIVSDPILLEFANLKGYCQFDLFGTECSYYQLNEETDMISDAQRINKIKLLKENGKLDQILMSHDIHTKHRLMKFGGHGYAHILNNVVPKMLIKGFTKDEIDTILIKNPKRWLSY